MFKRIFSSLVLVATVVLYGCGGGGGGGGVADPLVSIDITPATPSIPTGATQQFTAMGTYAISSPKDLTTSVTWSSDTLSVATINATTGMATAVGVGTATITATSGTITKTTILTVTKPLAATVLAGSGTAGAANGTGAAAQFNNPNGITTDGTFLYVADTSSHAVRKIEASTGLVTTIATLPNGALNNPATLYGITKAGSNLYVTDGLNNTIYQVDSVGGVITFAGSGTAGSLNGTGTAAQFNQPMDITTDGTNLYVADYNNHRIRKIDIATKVVSNFSATINFPRGLAIDTVNLYVTDDSTNNVTKINLSTEVLEIVAGSLTGVSGTANGTGLTARFNKPLGITSDGTNLYVADSLNYSIRKINIASQNVTTALTQTGSIQPLGITRIGSILYTTNNDNTIKIIQ